MKLIRIKGPSLLLICAGCNQEGIGGDEAYRSASTGEERIPEEWYQEKSQLNRSTYCASCAVKLVKVDPTRSITQFYANTKGMEIKFENLPE